MERRRLGRTELEITPLGIGTWAIGGGGYRWGWGPQDDEESIAAVHRGLELGMNWVDTAPLYGMGRSEEVVERALRGLAERPYVFTKCGLRWNEAREVTPTLKAESVRAEVEDSLRRLRVEAIDLMQIHWPLPDEDVEEAWGALAELKEQGKLREIGVSNFSGEQLRRAQRIAPVASNQPPYSLLAREAEPEILPFCLREGIGVIVYSPMACGLLTGAMTRERAAGLPPDDFRLQDPRFQEPALSQNLALAERLRAVAARHGRSAGEAAIAWTLRNPAVTGAIVGVRRADQAEGLSGAAGVRLTDEEVAEIEGAV